MGRRVADLAAAAIGQLIAIGLIYLIWRRWQR